MQRETTEVLDHFEWLQIYEKLKNDNIYKFIYSDMDAYEKKINKMLNEDYRFHKNIIKKSDHNQLLQDLKINFLKISHDLHLLDLAPLALAIEYIFDTLINCLRSTFTGFTNSVSVLREEKTSSQTKFFGLQRCQECQVNIEKIRIEGLKTMITVCDGKPNERKLNRLDNQIDNLQVSFNDVELSLMIDEVLQGKENVLNSKNNRITSIYEEIAQYLESIPQETINMSQENYDMDRKNIMIIDNISQQIESGLTQMLRKPVNQLIHRIFLFFKKQFENKKMAEAETQTFTLSDQETIKTLNKKVESLKREFLHLKETKREVEKDAIRMIEEKQKNDMKIQELNSVNAILEQKCHRLQRDSRILEFNLKESEKSRKEFSDSLIRDYTEEKATYQKAIHEMEVKIQSANAEIKRLRRMTQNSMISREIQAFISASCAQSGVQTSYEEKSDEQNLNYLSPRNQSGLKNSFINKRSAFIANRKTDGKILIPKERFEEQQVSYPDTGSEKLTLNSFQNGKKSARESHTVRQSRQRISLLSETPLNPSNDAKSFLFDDKKMDRIHEAEENPKGEGRRSNNSRRSSKLSNRSEVSVNPPWTMEGYLKRKKKKACSSRMFVPTQHCAPYIGNQMGNDGGLSTHSSRLGRIPEIIRQSLEDEEDTEKIEIISKIMVNYDKLIKQKAFKEFQQVVKNLPAIPEVSERLIKPKINRKINSMVIMKKKKTEQSSNEEDPLKINPISSITAKKAKLSEKSNKISIRDVESRKSKNRESPTAMNLNILSQNCLQKAENQSQTPVFLRKHILLLFESEAHIKKYEKCEEIWGLLENSIMVDSSFILQCESACSFFLKIQNSNRQLFNECLELLISPLKYWKKIERKQSNENPGFRKKGVQQMHQRHHSSLPFEDNQKKDDISVIRGIILKLLRFHKIIHEKCSHMQEFFSVIGHKNSKP